MKGIVPECLTRVPPIYELQIRNLLVQNFVHERDCDRSLSDRRRDSLDIAGASITHREYSRQTCLQKMRRAAKRPLRFREVFGREIGSSFDEPFGIESHTTLEPWCVRNGAGH